MLFAAGAITKALSFADFAETLMRLSLINWGIGLGLIFVKFLTSRNNNYIQE